MRWHSEARRTIRTFFATWRVEAHEQREVTFPFASGFGCGQTVKVSQGHKQVLETQIKAIRQGGLKIPGAVEFSASTTDEVSMKIGHEYTNMQEWSYTAPACEYCLPEIAFPDAQITVWARLPLHLPFFVAKVVAFDSGARSEIRGNCRKDPQRCHNCPDVKEGPGMNPLLSASHPSAASLIYHVVLADRSSSGGANDVVDGLLVAPAQRLFVLGLAGTVLDPTREPVLLSVDDVDRALGVIRLQPDDNRLHFLVPESTSLEAEPTIQLQAHGDWDHSIDRYSFENPTEALSRLSLRLLTVDLHLSRGVAEATRSVLSMQFGQQVREWPVILLPALMRSESASTESAGARLEPEEGVFEV